MSDKVFFLCCRYLKNSHTRYDVARLLADKNEVPVSQFTLTRHLANCATNIGA